jgi:hypothetical protein
MSREIFLVFGITGLSADFTSGEATVGTQKAALPILCAATTIPHS